MTWWACLWKFLLFSLRRLNFATSPDFKIFTRATNIGNKARWWAGVWRSLNNVYENADMSNHGSHVHMFASNADGGRHLRLPRAAPFNATFAFGQREFHQQPAGRKKKSGSLVPDPTALKGAGQADAHGTYPSAPSSTEGAVCGARFPYSAVRVFRHGGGSL